MSADEAENACVFRRAEAADLPAIIRLLVEDPLGATREDPSDPPAPAYRAAFEAIDADPNQLLAVGERLIDGAREVVATLQITVIPGLARLGARRGQIEAVRVRGDQRGARIGEALFRWAIDECRARGCALVQLTSDKSRDDAHRFYERLGFTASHEGYKRTL